MTTFLIIGAVGLVLLVISLLLGDLFGGAFEAFAGDVFSSAVVGGFVAAFGFGGATADALGAPGLLSVLIGIVVGVGFGWFAAWLTRIVRGGHSDDTPASADAIGREASVLTDIPADGFGIVRVRVGGHTVQFNAKADRAIGVGTAVHVTGTLSPTAVTVAPVWDDLELPERADNGADDDADEGRPH